VWISLTSSSSLPPSSTRIPGSPAPLAALCLPYIWVNPCRYPTLPPIGTRSLCGPPSLLLRRHHLLRRESQVRLRRRSRCVTRLTRGVTGPSQLPLLHLFLTFLYLLRHIRHFLLASLKGALCAKVIRRRVSCKQKNDETLS